MLQRVGKYEVKQLLGKGASGSVYLATDPFRQREVAVKVLENLSPDPEQARRQLRLFQNEAALAGKLRHPHIVSILDAGLEDGSGGEPLRYLVMEVVDGPALTRYCEPTELLEPKKAVEIGYKCCKALEFANTLGVVHRDIKPANILIEADSERVKLTDFGLARAAEDMRLTQTGFVTAIPYLFGTIAMILWARHSDATRERVAHVGGPLLLTALALGVSSYITNPAITMVVLTVAAIGIFCTFAVFWTLPTAWLSGTAAAGGIALINSIGNLAGFGGPYLIGWVKEATGNTSTGLLVLSLLPLAAGLLVFLGGHETKTEFAGAK